LSKTVLTAAAIKDYLEMEQQLGLNLARSYEFAERLGSNS